MTRTWEKRRLSGTRLHDVSSFLSPLCLLSVKKAASLCFREEEKARENVCSK